MIFNEHKMGDVMEAGHPLDELMTVTGSRSVEVAQDHSSLEPIGHDDYRDLDHRISLKYLKCLLSNQTKPSNHKTIT